MSFQFVDNNSINEAARRRIRSHVMRGKNVGKTHQNRARRRQTEALVPNSKFESDDFISAVVIAVPRTLGNSFSFFTFSSREQPYMRSIVSQCRVPKLLIIHPIH